MALELNSPIRLEFDLMATWQARALRAAEGVTHAVLLSVLAHNYDDQMLTLLQIVYPGFSSITAPFLSSAARVMKNGAIVADVVRATGVIEKKVVLYRDGITLRDDFRRLADRIALSDQDREQMFIAVQNWVVADYRLDPAMDPKDPDAKRLH